MPAENTSGVIDIPVEFIQTEIQPVEVEQGDPTGHNVVSLDAYREARKESMHKPVQARAAEWLIGKIGGPDIIGRSAEARHRLATGAPYIPAQYRLNTPRQRTNTEKIVKASNKRNFIGKLGVSEAHRRPRY